MTYPEDIPPDFKKSLELTEPLPANWKYYLYEKLGDHF